MPSIGISATLSTDLSQRFLESFSQLMLQHDQTLKVEIVISGPIDAPNIQIKTQDPSMVTFDLLRRLKV